jgi:hypothetical protein
MTPKREQPTEEAPEPAPEAEPVEAPPGFAPAESIVAGEGEVVVVPRVKLNGFPIGVPVALVDNDELRAAIENGLAVLA